MASGNDPANIPFIIAENGFYYVAYKEKVKVPEIVVSSKGVANGLSEEYNDGWDFGPDSYNPNSTANPPYTQTSGIQEAINYVQSLGSSTQNGVDGNWSPDIYLNAGVYVVNDDATIYVNNEPNNYTATGLHIHGSSGGQYNCAIVKQNSLSSPIISFSNPRGSSTTGATPTQMIFENFAVWYMGSASNATSGVTVVNLSIEETGGTLNVYRNLMVLTSNPINNVMLDLSGNEDAEIDNVYTQNAGGTYDSSITVASFVTHMTDGNLKIYNGEHSGIDIDSQNAYLAGMSIGTAAGAGIIWRPNINGSPLLLDSVYFNGALTRLITTQPTSGGATLTGYILMNGCLLSKTPTSSGDYMLDFSAVPTYLEMRSTELVNNNTADTLYLLNPSNTNVTVFKGYDDITGRSFMIGGVTLNIPTPTLSANPPVSATVYQNTNPYAIEIDLPVYATTAGTAGYVTVAKGQTDTPTAIGNQYVSGDTSDTSEQIIRLRVPVGWYYEFTSSGVTFGTASVFAD